MLPLTSGRDPLIDGLQKKKKKKKKPTGFLIYTVEVGEYVYLSLSCVNKNFTSSQTCLQRSCLEQTVKDTSDGSHVENKDRIKCTASKIADKKFKY